MQINAQIHALHRQIEAETNRINRMIAAAKAELSNRRRDYQDKRAIAITEVAEAEAALGVARSKRDRYQLIADSKAISKNQLEEAQLEVAEQEQAVEAARAKLQRAQTTLNPIDAEVAIAAERIAQEQASGQANLAEDTTRPQASGTATTDFVAANHNSNAAIAFYEVMIEPETQTFGQGNNQCALQSGMEARVDIITREETVLQFLLRKARLMTDV